jgi:tetratricopeptide (TPR) repeat protein
MIAINDQNFDEAIDCFKEAVNLKPDFTEAHFNLGVAYQDQVKVPEMVLAYRNVIHHGEPGNELISHAEDILNTIEEQLKESDGITLDEYIESYNIFDQGVTYMDTRDWENAIIKFDETIDITPNHPQVYGNIGICYASLGKKEEALDAFDKALKIDPEYEPALLNREIVTSLKEGECLNNEVKAIEYYMDYPRKNKSFIQEYADELGLLPEK